VDARVKPGHDGVLVSANEPQRSVSLMGFSRLAGLLVFQSLQDFRKIVMAGLDPAIHGSARRAL